MNIFLEGGWEGKAGTTHDPFHCACCGSAQQGSVAVHDPRDRGGGRAVLRGSEARLYSEREIRDELSSVD